MKLLSTGVFRKMQIHCQRKKDQEATDEFVASDEEASDKEAKTGWQIMVNVIILVRPKCEWDPNEYGLTSELCRGVMLLFETKRKNRYKNH